MVDSSASARPGALPLRQLLGHCADAVAAVLAGRSLTDALNACPPSARPGTQALSFIVMRRLGLAQALRARLVPKRPAPWVDALLLSALALLTGEEYGDHTLVDQAVEATKRRARPAAGLVNAVLRRFLRERVDLVAQVRQADPVARWNHPAWWIEQLRQDWPTAWEGLLDADQQAAPMVLRVNQRRVSRDAYLARLATEGLQGRPVGTAGIVLETPVPVQRLPGFGQGDVSVQDASAQRAAELLLNTGLPPGARVLDACSAPGGKTAHLLEAAEVQVLSLDVDAGRLERVTQTLERLGLQAQVRAADAGSPDTWWDGTPFDAILLDAPCSASGIVRRHPDVPWLRRPADIPALAATQDRLLDALWPLLRPGGHLLYCTCSVFPLEGQRRIDAFLQRQPLAQALPAPGHLLPVVEYPDPSGSPQSPDDPGFSPPTGDGFYYALLRKPAA